MWVWALKERKKKKKKRWFPSWCLDFPYQQRKVQQRHNQDADEVAARARLEAEKKSASISRSPPPPVVATKKFSSETHSSSSLENVSPPLPKEPVSSSALQQQRSSSVMGAETPKRSEAPDTPPAPAAEDDMDKHAANERVPPPVATATATADEEEEQADEEEREDEDAVAALKLRCETLEAQLVDARDTAARHETTLGTTLTVQRSMSAAQLAKIQEITAQRDALEAEVARLQYALDEAEVAAVDSEEVRENLAREAEAFEAGDVSFVRIFARLEALYYINRHTSDTRLRLN